MVTVTLPVPFPEVPLFDTTITMLQLIEPTASHRGSARLVNARGALLAATLRALFLFFVPRLGRGKKTNGSFAILLCLRTGHGMPVRHTWSKHRDNYWAQP